MAVKGIWCQAALHPQRALKDDSMPCIMLRSQNPSAVCQGQMALTVCSMAFLRMT